MTGRDTAAPARGDGDRTHATGDDDLHGNVPGRSRVALLLVDVVNDFEYPGGAALFAHALPVAQRLAALMQAARSRGIPVVYANDNFGRWRDDRGRLLQHCLQDGVRGEPVARLLAPHEEDYFVLKPKHSAFFATPLALLLEYLGARTLVLGGFTGDICVLLTAADAYLRDYRLAVPADCVASIDPIENDLALRYAARVFHADTTPSVELNLDDFLTRGDAG